MSRLNFYAALLSVLTIAISPGFVLAQSVGSGCQAFTMNLKVGSSGSAVIALQTALEKDGESVPATGYFGKMTAAAVAQFQAKYASVVLTPYGLKQGTGYVGAATRAELNALYGCSTGSMGNAQGKAGAPAITSLSPSFGPIAPVATLVTITGSGFTATGNTIYFRGGPMGSSIFPGRQSSDGSTLQFRVPTNANASTTACNASGNPGGCDFAILPGVYTVVVGNANGMSNSMQFTVITNPIPETSIQPNLPGK